MAQPDPPEDFAERHREPWGGAGEAEPTGQPRAAQEPASQAVEKIQRAVAVAYDFPGRAPRYGQRQVDGQRAAVEASAPVHASAIGGADARSARRALSACASQ